MLQVTQIVRVLLERGLRFRNLGFCGHDLMQTATFNNMQHATSTMRPQRERCGMYIATRSTQQETRRICDSRPHRATCGMQRVTCTTIATCTQPGAADSVQRAALQPVVHSGRAQGSLRERLEERAAYEACSGTRVWVGAPECPNEYPREYPRECPSE